MPSYRFIIIVEVNLSTPSIRVLFQAPNGIASEFGKRQKAVQVPLISG